MHVELLNYTQDALTLLLRTKGTRLAHEDDPAGWPEERRLAELAYMKHTIKSSWEFCDFTFRISGVSRSFTHQFVRTRQGSFAQESMRSIDSSGNGYLADRYDAEEVDSLARHEVYDQAMLGSFDAYRSLLAQGMPPQDARNVLPNGVLTSIIAKFNLRTLHDMALVRLCTRVQDEYQNVFREMKARVVEVYPWAEPFIRVSCAQTGICVFQNYTDCPIQPLTYNSKERRAEHEARVAEIAIAADTIRHEAKPFAKSGRTM